MENNFIQMAASTVHAYTIDAIFKLIIVRSCISPMASRILSFKSSIVSGVTLIFDRTPLIIVQRWQITAPR